MCRKPEILCSPLARRLALVLGGVALLAGCGQKGNLYLPSQPSATLPQVLHLSSPARPAIPAASAASAPASAPTPVAPATLPMAPAPTPVAPSSPDPAALR